VTDAFTSVEMCPSCDGPSIILTRCPRQRADVTYKRSINSIYWMAAIWWCYLLVTVINLANC